MSYSCQSGANKKKKRAERKAVSEQICQTFIHLKLDETWQLQFNRPLLKGGGGPEVNVGNGPGLFSQGPCMEMHKVWLRCTFI